MNIFLDDDEDDLMGTPVASSTECTVLIPALPQSEAQIESYEDIYPFMTPPKDKEPKVK